MPRNYVLIILDCVRKDFFDEFAPRLQELSDVSFEQCRAASSWSPPSHASLFTGDLPHVHGVHTYSRDFATLGEDALFFNDLSDHTTLAVNANPAIGSSFGFDELFDEYVEEIWLEKHRVFRDGLSPSEYDPPSDRPIEKYLGYGREVLGNEYKLKSLLNAGYWQFEQLRQAYLPIPKLKDDGASSVIDSSLELLERTDEPFFLFINFLDAHHNYQNIRGFDQGLHDVDDRWKSSIADDFSILFNESIDGYETYVENRRALYGAAVDYLDRLVSTFLERVDTMTGNETTVIVTADHGDNLGYPEDDHMVHHKSSMSEALLHVPLELVNPPAGFAPTEDRLFSHLDVGELVRGFEEGETRDLFRNRIPAERIGSFPIDSFVRNVERADGFDLPEEEFDGAHEYFDRIIRVAYDEETKYQWDSVDRRAKFRLDFHRPCWQALDSEDVHIPRFAADFFETDFEELERQTRSDHVGDIEGDLDPTTKDQLRQLGYL